MMAASNQINYFICEVWCVRRVIINNFITIFLVIIYLIVPFAFVKQVNNNSIYASEIQEESYEFYPIIEKFSYKANEDIDLSFAFKTDYNFN